MYGIGMEYVWNRYGIWMEYARNMYGVCMEYVWNIMEQACVDASGMTERLFGMTGV